MASSSVMILTITVPTGKWVRRKDEKVGASVPILAYGMESCVFVIWSDGSHTTEPLDWSFPASNWEVWEEIE